jgi:hypothetical protein
MNFLKPAFYHKKCAQRSTAYVNPHNYLEKCYRIEFKKVYTLGSNFKLGAIT